MSTNNSSSGTTPNSRPLIRQINMAGTVFDICADKDWEVNTPDHKDFIANRTHFKEKVVYYPEDKCKEYANDGKQYLRLKEGTDPITEADIYDFYRIEQLPSVQHEFINTYSHNGSIQTSDLWQVDVPWFSLGNSYNLKLQLIDERGYPETLSLDKVEFTSNTKSITLTAETGTTVKLGFLASTNTFYLEGETFSEPLKPDGSNKPYTSGYITGSFSSDYPISLPNLLTITPIEGETYINSTQQLAADYIPIDNKTIRRTADGKLFVDDVFKDDFFVSKPFGKYPERTWVSAANKTTKEVLMEAFAEVLQPTILFDEGTPAKISFSVADTNNELGTQVTLNWTLRLDPNKYTYGTLSGNDSNLWAEYIKLSSTNENLSGVTFTVTDAITEFEAEGTNPLTIKLKFPEDIKIEHPEGSKQPMQIAKGTVSFRLPSKAATINPVAQVEVKLARNDKDFAVDVSGKNQANPPKKIGIMSDSPIPEDAAKYDLTQTDGQATSHYLWYWRYLSLAEAESSKHELGDFGKNEETISNFFKEANSTPNNFPGTVTTEQLKYIYFAAPKGKASLFKLLNTVTGMATGKVKYLQKENSTDNRIIKIKDAANTYHDYEVLYLKLGGADLDKNTYKLDYSN